MLRDCIVTCAVLLSFDREERMAVIDVEMLNLEDRWAVAIFEMDVEAEKVTCCGYVTPETFGYGSSGWLLRRKEQAETFIPRAVEFKTEVLKHYDLDFKNPDKYRFELVMPTLEEFADFWSDRCNVTQEKYHQAESARKIAEFDVQNAREESQYSNAVLGKIIRAAKLQDKLGGYEKAKEFVANKEAERKAKHSKERAEERANTLAEVAQRHGAEAAAALKAIFDKA